MWYVGRDKQWTKQKPHEWEFLPLVLVWVVVAVFVFTVGLQ